VIDAVSGWFQDFVDRVECGYQCHRSVSFRMFDMLPRFGPVYLPETTFPTTTTVRPFAALVPAVSLIAAVTAATVATLFSIR
jgi:hypothetical protein